MQLHSVIAPHIHQYFPKYDLDLQKYNLSILQQLNNVSTVYICGCIILFDVIIQKGAKNGLV